MNKEQDAATMEKGAWDGKTCGAMAVALTFLFLLEPALSEAKGQEKK